VVKYFRHLIAPSGVLETCETVVSRAVGTVPPM